MTALTPAVLKTYFETNDKPTQSQFADLIDSSINQVVSAAQRIQSDVSALGSLDLPNNGMTIGGPMGGNKGAGTVNVASNFFINGTAIGTPSGSGTVNVGVTNQLAYYPSSSNSVSGTNGIPNGTTATTQTALDNSTKIATTAYTDAAVAVLSVPIFTKSFISSQQTLTSGGTLTLPHSLGGKPLFITTTLVCQSSENGFSTGDELTINLGSPISATGSVNTGGSVTWDITNVYVTFTSQSTIFSNMTNKSNGGRADLTNGNWKLVIRAFA